jgi:hypothetical protein
MDVDETCRRTVSMDDADVRGKEGAELDSSSGKL